MSLGKRSTTPGLREGLGRTFEPRMPRDHGVWRVDKAIAGFRRSNDRADRTPPRTRGLQARALVHVSLDAPRPVLRITASLCRQEDPAVLRRVVAKASLDVSGRSVRAHAAAPSESEAIALLESRLHRRLHELAQRDIARRHSGQLPETPLPSRHPRRRL